MLGNWQKVYSTYYNYRAEIIKSVLEDQAIQSVIINKQDTSYQIGQVEVYVTPENVLSAIKIIEDDIQFE